MVDHFGMNPTIGTFYEFVRKVLVNNGPCRSVQVIIRYTDSREYACDAGSMGGANATLQPFSLFQADWYKWTNPEKIIASDGKRHGI